MPADVKELLQQGKVQETIQTLTQYLREHPADTARRTFLFELLCFAGEYARAEKQLAVLASGSPEKETGSVVYYAALMPKRIVTRSSRRRTFLKALKLRGRAS